MMSTKINTTPLQTKKALQKNIRVEELYFKTEIKNIPCGLLKLFYPFFACCC